MKKLFALLVLFGTFALPGATLAQDKSSQPAAEGAKVDEAKPAAATAVTGAPAAAPAAAAAGAPSATATPKCGDKGFDCNKGDVAWMMTSTAFVLLMTVPGLALFYAGMARSKNALSTVMQSFSIFCVIAVLWVIYGYSMAFTAGHEGSALAPFIGSLDKLFMAGDDPTTAVAATFSKGQYLPDFVYAMFQLTFAAITVALICGAYAERFKFSAMIIFSILWFTFAYLPVAHMVWYWDGPDAYTNAKAADIATRPATMPEQMPSRLGLPLTIHSVSAQATPAVAVPNKVLKNAMPAPPLASSADPALKPNQPIHSMPVPMAVIITLCGAICTLP